MIFYPFFFLFILGRTLSHFCWRSLTRNWNANVERSFSAVWRHFVSPLWWFNFDFDCVLLVVLNLFTFLISFIIHNTTISIFFAKKVKRQLIKLIWLLVMNTEFFFLIFRDCRVVRDPQTLKSKGYGFVSFVKKSVSFSAIIFISIFMKLNEKINFTGGWKCYNSYEWSIFGLSVNSNKLGNS